MTAIVNGINVSSYATDYKDMHLTYAWRTAAPECLGVGCFMTPFILHSASVTEITGHGTTLRLAGAKGVPRFDKPAEEAAWEKAVDLLPMIDTTRDTIAGTWTHTEKGLTCSAEAFARLEIPYKPAEEYDYKMVFSYASGEPEVHQFVSMDKSSFQWCLNGWKKGFENCASFQSFDRYPKDTVNPSTAYLPVFFKPNQLHTSVVMVRRKVASAYLDGQCVSYLRIGGVADGHPILNWSMPTKGILGVGSNKCAITIQRLEVLEINGKGTKVDAAELRKIQALAPQREPNTKDDPF
ncbi:MAG: hypothetical protein WCT04_25640 [Planctomycetota bacterium]